MVSSVVQARALADPGEVAGGDEVEITVAAIRAFGRLMRAVERRIKTHPAGDGGLICEDRTVRASPVMWRISSGGAVLPDTPYSYVTRSFTFAKLPRELASR